MTPRVVLCCISVARWTPVIFITTIVVWSYYAYVLQMCLFTVDSIAEKAIYLLIFHPLLFMFAWSYWKIIFTEVKDVPREFFLSSIVQEQFDRAPNDDAKKDVLLRFADNLPVVCRTINGAPRYCEKCKAVKPDRCHHCSVCGRCILKMDHHCPWVNNCVGHTNYKFFVLFLFYALMYCLYVGGTSLKYFIMFWTRGVSASSNAVSTLQTLHIVFLFFASIMFAVSLVVLFGYHCVLVASNRSTLEAFRTPIFSTGPEKNGFSLGYKRNLREVFGNDKRLWLLPVYSSNGDGVVYATCLVPNNGAQDVCLSMNNASQQPSEGSGVTYPIRSAGDDEDTLLGQRMRWAEEGDADSVTAVEPV